MRYRADNTEMQRHGDGFEDLEWDSLSARARRRSNTRPPHKYRGKFKIKQPVHVVCVCVAVCCGNKD